MTSIRLRLFAILLAATGVVWLSAFVWIQQSTRAEVERVLDARLAEAGQMVSSLISDQRIDLASAASAVVAAPPSTLTQGYSHRLSCQIWSLDGQLVGQSSSAPVDKLTQTDSGFSTDIVDGEVWRVYSVVNEQLGVRVMVGDSQTVRDRLVRDVTTGLVVPAVLILPFLAALIWLSLRGGLLPLERLAKGLTRRKASDLAPMPVVGLPDEIRPVAQALNGLFDRVTAAREREQAFTAFAAHELKTPLAGINTHAQIALIAQDDATRRRALDRIQQGVAQTDRLVRQLLTMAQVDSTDIIDNVLIDVDATVRRVVEDLAGLASLHGVAVAVQFGTQAFLNSDDVLLSLALRNLLENAIVASPRDSVVEIRIDRTGTELRLCILDRGPGIADADRQRIMNRFVRGRDAAHGGSGLGLAIVKAAIEHLGGELSFWARDGGGEVFCITISDHSSRVPRSELEVSKAGLKD